MRQRRSGIAPQAVGAFGEKAVEAELLRHGWVPSNVNATMKNAEDFDIFALKNSRTVHLRVKACSAEMNAFQFGGFTPGQEIRVDGFSNSDFTILVRMGITRQCDEFYVIPTREVRKQISESRRAYLAQKKRDGQLRVDRGHWTLHLLPLRSGEVRPSVDLAKTWRNYLGTWDLLETVHEV